MNIKHERVIAEAEWSAVVAPEGIAAMRSSSGKIVGWYVMWADGSVDWFATKPEVVKAVAKRLGKADILVSEVEWRS